MATISPLVRLRELARGIEGQLDENFIDPDLLEGLTPPQRGVAYCLAQRHAEVAPQTYLPFSDTLVGDAEEDITPQEEIWLYVCGANPSYALEMLRKEYCLLEKERGRLHSLSPELRDREYPSHEGAIRHTESALREVGEAKARLERASAGHGADREAFESILNIAGRALNTTPLHRPGRIDLLEGDALRGATSLDASTGLYAIADRYRREPAMSITRILGRLR